MKTKFLSFVVVDILFSMIIVSAQTVNWEQYLKSQTPPPFRQGHTLYPLTLFGYFSNLRDFPTMSELAGNWGFALEFTSSKSFNSSDTVKIKTYLNDPTTNEYKYIQLAKSNPDKYKLHLPATQFRTQGMVPFTPEECPDCYSRDSAGNVIIYNTFPVLNPLMSEATLARCGQKYAWPFKYIERQFGVKVGMGIHQGEAAVWNNWDNDPLIVADRGTEDKNMYRDKKFARILSGFFTPIQTSLRDDGLFVYYSNGGNWDKGRYGGWVNGVPAYIEYTLDATVLPSSEHYWRSFNSGGTCDNPLLYSYSFLTKYLASTGQEIAQGKPFSYEWTSPNWATNTAIVAPMTTWTGALKSMYIGGMLGANVGYYGTETVYPEYFDMATPPLNVTQAMQGSRVHALFSWIEPFVRNSDLLPGPHMHAYTGLPAYEFLNQTNADRSTNSINCGSRVMARKHKTNNEWLISAWNQDQVGERDVTVEIPILGSITVRLRNSGTLYYAKLNGVAQELTMLDTDGMLATIDTTLLKSKFGQMYATPNVAISAVSISPTTAKIPSIGKTLQLKAIVTPTEVVNKFVTWKSSNNDIAWVSPSGVVTGVTPGNVTITATTFVGNKSASATITVDNQPVAVTGIRLYPLYKGMDVKDEFQLEPKIAPEIATNKNIIWSSSNQSVATVSNTGVVKAVSVGSAVITATTVDGGKSAKTDIFVTPYSGGDGLRGFYYSNTSLSGTPFASKIDTTINFNWSVTPFPGINISRFSVLWAGQIQPIYSEEYTFETRVNDGVRLWVNNVLIIDRWTKSVTADINTGKIKLEAGVKYNIVLQYFQDGNSASALLSWSSKSQDYQVIRKSRLFSVAQLIPVASISTSPATSMLKINETVQIVSLIAPTNATNRNIIWSSSNSNVATVSANGLVTGVAQGTALIIANTIDSDRKDTTVITVSDTLLTICSLFSNKTPSSYGNEGDFELGVKFSTSINGYITKIRYYKTAGESGSHTGRIWYSKPGGGGDLLASVVFTNETATGWQEMPLATPLLITTGNIYLVSVNANLTFAYEPLGLVTPIINCYLSTPDILNNGFYHPIPGTYPNLSDNKPNYYRDVVFEPNLYTNVQNSRIHTDILIYPNPTNGILYIEAPDKSKIEVLDLMGRTVYTAKTNAPVTKLDLSVNQGLLLVKVNNIVTQKVIVK